MALFLPTSATANRIAPIAVLTNTTILTSFLPKKPTLAEVLLGAPRAWTLSALAAWLGVPSALLDRIAAGRQPLPRRLAERMAAAAQLQVGDILAVVPSVTDVETPIAYRPAPADACFGDTLDFVPLARTVEVYV